MSTIQFRDDTIAEDSSQIVETRQKKGNSDVNNRLSRVRSLTISRIPTDMIDDASKTSLRSRRVRLSDDVRPVYRHSGALTSRRKESIESNHFAELDLLKEKGGLETCLRSLNNVLSICESNPEKSFKASNQGAGYSVQVTTDKLTAESVICLLQIIRRAVDLEMKGVYTDHGRWISMTHFLRKIKALMKIDPSFRELMKGRNYELLEKTVIHFSEKDEVRTKRKNLKSLRQPRFARSLPPNEKTVVYLLQRISPGGSKSKGYIDPITMILVYPRFVSTERFFELIKLLLLESDNRMPKIQKHRLLNLCRTWVAKRYHPDQLRVAKVLTRIQKIANIGLLSEDPTTVQLGYDLSSHLTRAPLFVRQYRMVDGSVSFQTLVDQLTKVNFNKTVETVVSDCYEMSRAIMLNLPLYELLIKPDETFYQQEIVDRFETLSNFVSESIVAPIRDLSSNKASSLIALRLKFWICVADSLLEKGDFSLGLAVVSALSNSSVSRLYSEGSGGRLECLGKNLSKRLFKKRKKMGVVFSPLGDFRNLKAALAERKRNGESYIPDLGMISRHLVYSNDGNPEEVDGVINVEKLHIIGSILSDFWKGLAKLRLEASKYPTVVYFHTDLVNTLKNRKNICEDDLWKLSTQIKPFGNK